jgi:protein-L-isoaspartate(D-aspartate) O-methyltransferase
VGAARRRLGRNTIFQVFLVGLFVLPSVDPFVSEREDMVKEQIIEREIEDKSVISAMRKVPRHLFVPEAFRSKAYEDSPQPIGEGQTISQPYIVALMTELLELEANDRVLEIGTGSGYQAAVLAEIAKEVYSIEIISSLHESAREILGDLGYLNIVLKQGDGYAGWEEHAPFDAIVVTAAPPHIPQPLISQLADGGIMVIPVGDFGDFQTLQKVKKVGDRLKIDKVSPVRFVPFIMPGSGEKKQQ